MTKSVVPNFKKWNIDERRLLVIFLLTLIYPVFVTSFFALYLFVLMPVMVSPLISLKEAHHEGWYHFYWLFVSMLWVILCALILPFFKKQKIQHTINLSTIESSSLIQPAIKVEVKDVKGSQSNLSQKSENSSENIKKATSDLESEKESLGKSRESLSKSSASLDRKKLTQSGEFLNDCMSTIHSEDIKKNDTVCEIHAEEADNDIIKKYSDQEKELVDEQKDCESEREASEDKSRKDKEDEVTSDIKDVNTKELLDKNKEGDVNKYSDNSSENSSSDEYVEPLVSAQKAKNSQRSSPLKVNDAKVEQHEDTEELEIIEEVDKLDSDIPNMKRQKALPTIDTSRASGCYECSMPTPLSVESTNSQNNTVFLFINPETEATEDSILVSHGGKVEDSQVEKTEP